MVGDASMHDNSAKELPMKMQDPEKVHIKKSLDPSLFKIKVQKKHLGHLINDDLDEVSKFEVIYKILKDQLREH